MDHDLLERVIVSPVAGVFRPVARVHRVAAGATVGHVRAGSEDVPVVSPFDGELVDVCAAEGERLEPFQRIAWLRVA